MCGIAGVFGQSDEDTLDSMLSCLSHRGPNGVGQYTAPDADMRMGMRRLSVIDLETGMQPIYNEDESVVVVFNGEIYNYRELRSRLVERGHEFSTETDTEVLVHLWEEYGEDLPAHLDGMFAFALWDRERESLFLARDRVGIKPLYIATDGDRFVWASEIEPLLLAGVDPTLDQTAVQDYFTFRFSPWPRTLFSSVESVEPGTSLLVTTESVTRRRYWTPTTTETTCDDPAGRLRELLDRAVRRRLVADVPVGAFLSGGLDSAAIVALMSQYQDEIKTYSIGFESAEYDESDEAAFVAETLGTDHHEATLTPAMLADLPDIVSSYGEPLADPAILPTAKLSRLASQDVTVVLTGEGADELFGGYWYYDALRRHRRLARRVPSPAFSLAAAASERTPVGRRHLRYAAGLSSDRAAVTTVGSQFRRPPETYVDTDESRDSSAVVDRAFEHARPESAHRQMAFDLRYGLPDNLLYKVDRATMRSSLEARVPFLDHEIVDFAHSVPTSEKLDGRYKPLLRRAVSDLLPDRTLQRSKSGFNLPVAEWLRGGHDGLDRWLQSDRVAETPYVDADRVAGLCRDHRAGRRNHDLTLWKVLTYVCWYHTVVERYRS